MKVGSWDFEALSKAYGVRIIDRTYLPSEGRWPALNIVVIDQDDLPVEDKALQYKMTRHDGDGTEYDVYRFHGKLIACEAYEADEITAEDLAEWQAASSGCGYYTFIGQPWRD